MNIWVNEMMTKGNESPILYYKPQGENGNYDSCLSKNHFCLIIMTQFQLELFLKFDNDKICIDGTHSFNGYNYQLYSIVVVD
jgi:hypothetical protein